MSTCSKELTGKAKVQFRALATEIGENKAEAIFHMYDGFSRNLDGDENTVVNADDFFKELPNGKKSQLYNELKNKGLNPTPYFAVAFSDEFRKEKGDWITEVKKDKINKDKILKGFNRNTGEPTASTVIEYSKVLDGKEQVKTVNENNAVQLINEKYAEVYKDIYNVDVNFIPAEEAKEGAKAWYSSKDNTINVVSTLMTTDTMIHEMSHPIIAMFKRTHPGVYASLLVDLKNYKDEEWYKKVVEKYKGLSTLRLHEELLVTAIGLDAAGKLNKEAIKPESKTALQKITDIFKSLLTRIANSLTAKYGKRIDKEKGTIDLSGIDNMTISDFADVMILGLKIDGVEQGILDNNNFYDKDGNKIDISNYEELGAFALSFSKDLEDNKESSHTKKKLNLEQLSEQSYNYNMHRGNGGLLYATKYEKLHQKDNGAFNFSNAMAYRATVQDFGGKRGYKEQQKKDLEDIAKGGKGVLYSIKQRNLETAQKVEMIINDNIENNRAYGYGITDTVDKQYLEYYTDAKNEAEYSAKIGTVIHKHLENLFNAYQQLKDSGEEFDIDEFVLDFKTSKLGEGDAVYEDAIDGAVDFIKQIENENKGRKIVFKSELNVRNEELGLGSKIDLAVFYDDTEFEVYDIKSKKNDFDPAWNMGFENYEGDGVRDIRITGRNKTSLQTSIGALILEANTDMVFRSNRALYYDVDINTTRDSEGFINELQGVKLRTDKNNNYLSLNDYRSEVLNSLGEDKKDIFVNKSEYEDDAANEVKDIMDHLLDGNTIDNIDIDREARRKMRNLDINPDDSNDIGYFTGKYIADLSSFEAMAGKGKKEFISLKDKTDEERFNILKEFYKKKNESNIAFVNDIIEWNNTGLQPKSLRKGMVNKVQSIIKVVPEGYILKRLSDVKGMESFRGVPILIAEDPITKNSIFIYVSSKEDKPLYVGKDRKNIIGVDYADNVARVKIRDKKLREANRLNFRKLYLGLAAMKMKEVNPNFRVERLYVSKGATQSGMPHALDIKTIMPVTSIVLDNVRKKLSKPMQKLKDDIALRDVKSYKVSYINDFKNILSDSNIVKKEVRDKMIDDLESYQNMKIGFTDLLDKLMDLEKNMRFVIENELNQNIENNKEYILLAKTIREVFGINDSLINDSQSSVSRYITLEHNSPEEMRQQLRRITSLFDLAIRKEFNNYEKAKDPLLEKMFKSKKLSFNEKYVTQSMLKGYDNLFLNKDDYSNPDTLMKLKDPENYDDKSLNEEEREFIRFFNEQVYQQMKTLYPRMFENAANEEEAREITKGWVPVFKATIQTRQARMQTPSLKWDIQEQRIQGDRDDNLHMDNDFYKKFNSHMSLAGYNEELDEPYEGFDFNNEVETNLEYILGRFVVKGIETKMHNYTLFAHNSMDVLLKGQAFMFGEPSVVNRMLSDLNDAVSMYVRNESPHMSSMDKVMHKASYLSSMSVIAFSSKQAVMDTLTYTFASSANAMSNLIYKWFGGNTETLGYFDTKAWAKAGALVMKQDPLVKEIMREFALDTDDSLVLSGDSRLKSMRKGMMEMGFFVTKEMSIATTVQVFIAGMIYDGSFNAYSLDENGRLKYDEKKDLRFYTESGEIKDEDFLYAVKKEMFKEGQGIEEYDEAKGNDNLIDRKLTIGYTNKERTTIIYKSIDMIGAISKTTKIKAEQVLMFKYFLKFKTWLVAKKDLYLKEGMTSDSFNEWTRIVHPDGKVEYRLDPQYTEGIVYSVANIYHKLRAYGIKLENGGKLSDIERKNMAILITHAIFAGSMTLLAYGLTLTCDEDADFCWLDHSQTGKTVTSLLNNVRADMFVMSSLWDIINGRNSLFPALSLMTASVERIFKLIFSIPFQDDSTDSWLEQANDMLSKSWSTYRSTREFYEIVTGFEGNKQERQENKQRSHKPKLEFQTEFSKAFPIGGPYDIDWDEVEGF